MRVTQDGGMEGGRREAQAERARPPAPGPPRRPYGPGDLARRLARRRAELKLTRQQVAARAGLTLSYLDYLEESTARPTSADLRRLAAALQTTPAALLGAGLGAAPGGDPPARRPVLQRLTPAQCYDLLAPGGVGRFAFSTKAGPVVLPVNFAMAGRTIVFRTAGDSALSAHAYDEVGFEVDRLDEALCQGWSVLVTGTAHRVTDRGELSGLRNQIAVEPWAGGTRDVFVRINPARISGRVVQTG